MSREQINSVLSFHPSLRFVVTMRRDGTPLETVKRGGLEPMEPPDETRKILDRWAIGKGLTAGSDEFFGKMRTVIVRREKLVELLFPSTDYSVLVSADPTFPLDRIPQLEDLLRKLQDGSEE